MTNEKYKTHILPKIDLIKSMARNDTSKKEIAKALGVSYNTLLKYQSDYPLLKDALSFSKTMSDLEVEAALFEKAIGYTVVEEIPQKLKNSTYIEGKKNEQEEIEIIKVEKKIPADLSALKFWLERRCPEKWTDKATKQIDPIITVVHNIPRPERNSQNGNNN